MEPVLVWTNLRQLRGLAAYNAAHKVYLDSAMHKTCLTSPGLAAIMFFHLYKCRHGFCKVHLGQSFRRRR